MSLILKNESNFIPAPEGLHQAVCIDVVDLGLVDVTWKGKTRKVKKVRIAWEIEELMPDDKGRFICMSRYTMSMDTKSNLRKMLKTWRGVDFTADEMNGFDLEAILGVPCQLMITHTVKDGKTYANVESVIKAGKQKLSASGKYKRVKDREDYRPPSSSDNGIQDHPDEDRSDHSEEDIAF